MSEFRVKVNGYPAPLQVFKFPGGETNVKIQNPTAMHSECNVEVFAYVKDGDVMPLALIKDAIERTIPRSVIHLHLPYLPYARQDRPMVSGEALSVKIFADMVNSMNFASVTVDDCHSDVGLALLDRSISVPQHMTGKFLDLTRVDAVVAPDAGAQKKAFKFVQHFSLPRIVRADKVRDVSTGEILETVCQDNVEGLNLLIVDDICDGGRTFTELAKVLKEKGAKTVDLYVTHGIFSKGKQVLLDSGIDNVYSKYDWTEIL